ncbi:MAG: hypothetical protein WKF81_06660 [Thermomicrobiales bacterium]
MVRFVRWAISLGFLQSGSIAGLAWLLPGFSVDDPVNVVVVAFLMTGSLALGWPILYRISARSHPALFPLLSFMLAGTIVFIVSALADGSGAIGLHVAGIGTGAAVAAGLAGGNVLLGGLIPSVTTMPTTGS